MYWPQLPDSPRTKTEHDTNHQLERFQNKVEMAKKKVIMDKKGVRDTLGRDCDREGRIGIGGLKSLGGDSRTCDNGRCLTLGTTQMLLSCKYIGMMRDCGRLSSHDFRGSYARRQPSFG